MIVACGAVAYVSGRRAMHHARRAGYHRGRAEMIELLQAVAASRSGEESRDAFLIRFARALGDERRAARSTDLH